MCVDVFWILISDAGSTPATSTSLRFEWNEKWRLYRQSLFRDEAVLFQL